MLRSRTVKMTIAGTFLAVFFFIYFRCFWLEMSLSIIHLERSPQIRRYWFKCELEKRMITVVLSFFIGRHIGTSSAFVKVADRGFQVISAHNPFEIKKKC